MALDPLAIWITGERGILKSKGIFNKDNVEHVRCGFNLVPATKRKHNINDNLLDFNHPELGREGIYWKDYKRSHVLTLSDDPSDPMILIWNKFDGTMTNPVGELFILGELIDQKDRLEAENRRLRATILKLEQDNLLLSAQYAKWKDKYTPLLGGETDKVAEILGKAREFSRGATTA